MGETFYVIGPVLVVLALAISALGLRSDRFPSSAALRIVLPLFALVVAGTAVTAVVNARDEQEHRRAENEQAAEEEEAQVQSEEQAQAPEGEGEAVQPEQPAPESDLKLGETVFTSTGCESCHTLSATGATGTIGPNLDDVLQSEDPAFIRESIVDPGANVAEGFPDGTMPQTYGDDLSARELDALVAFLAQSTSTSN